MFLLQSRKVLDRWVNYKVFPCLVEILGGPYGEKFVDTASSYRYTQLPAAVFQWLINIRPRHLVFRTRNRCVIEPYLPCRFARQFRYDQLLVGNPNVSLGYHRNLLKGASKWYYSIAGDTRDSFVLIGEKPRRHLLLGFRRWHVGTNQTTNFCLPSSCVANIVAYFEEKGATKQGMQVRGMEEYTKAWQEFKEKVIFIGGYPKTRCGPSESCPKIETPYTQETSREAQARDTSRF